MKNKQISERISQPSPQDIHAARMRAGLTQTQAAQLISPAQAKPYRSWQPYEVPEGQKGGRSIPLATWELFLLLTDQHPHFSLVSHKEAGTKPVAVAPVVAVNPNQLGLPL